MYIIARSRVIIVDGYNIPTSMLKHKKNTTIIQIWHALAAVKKFGYQSVGYADGINPKLAKVLEMHKNYDYVIIVRKRLVELNYREMELNLISLMKKIGAKNEENYSALRPFRVQAADSFYNAVYTDDDLHFNLWCG